MQTPPTLINGGWLKTTWPLFSTNDPSKRSTRENTRTDLEIWEGDLESLQGHQPHPPCDPNTDTLALWVATVSGDEPLVVLYLCDSRRSFSLCFWDQTVRALLSAAFFPPSFHLWSSPGRYWRKSILKAMMMQQQATQGLFRSPILAHFQKIPSSPVLFLSSRLGAMALM